MLHLHCHSVYSYKDAIARVEDIAKTLKEQGESSFCITDHGSVTSYIKAFDIANKMGMTFIPGYEAYMRPQNKYSKQYVNQLSQELNHTLSLKSSSDEEKSAAQKELDRINSVDAIKYHHLTLIAINNTGIKNLFKLINTEELYYKNQITRENLFKYSEGLVCLSGCLAGELIYFVRRNMVDEANNIINEYKSTFGDRYFIELQYHELKMEEWETARGLLNEKDTYSMLVNLAKENDVPLVITNDSHYINKDEAYYHNLYKAINFNQDEEKSNNYQDGGYYLTTEEELRDRCSSIFSEDILNEAFSNIKVIENMVDKSVSFPRAAKLVDMNEELRQLCLEGWRNKRKGTQYERQSAERTKYELSVIKKLEFSEYFIRVLDICNCAKNNGILRGPGRGSGCGSEVCYLLGITDVDPIKYNLIFERFLNASRHGYPDIDLDFATIPNSHLLRGDVSGQ